MFKVVYNALLEWNRENDDRKKLQHSYMVFAVLAVIVAGLITLFNDEVGKNVLLIAGASAGIFVINAVVWGVVSSNVTERLVGRHKK